METYKCCHPVKAVIINTTPESLSAYFQWKESGTEDCIVCWIEQQKRRIKNESSI